MTLDCDKNRAGVLSIQNLIDASVDDGRCLVVLRAKDCGRPRDTRDIRELAQRIDSLMFEIIERLENLNGWLGQLPRVK